MKASSISFSISEREIAYAAYQGQKLISWAVHCFLLDEKGTDLKIAGDVTRAVNKFNPNACVLEIPADRGHALKLVSSIKGRLQSLGVPVFETTTDDIYCSFAWPRVTDRTELRRIIGSIFPGLPLALYMNSSLDAAAVGLHFETSRLLSINQS